MPLSPTPNYGLEKPTPGGDDDVWGAALNRNADTLDVQVKATDDRAALAAAQAAAAQAAADGKVAKIGDVMSGFLTLNADPTAPLHAATRQYVLANSAGLTDAPNDGALYGRQSLAWAKGVKLGGDTMTGALQTIAGTAATPALRMGDINSGLVGGADTVAVSTGGTARLTVSNTAVTSTLPVTLPAADPTGAAEAAHKGYVDAQVATRLTPAAADTAYVNVIGDTMSGALYTTALVTPNANFGDAPGTGVYIKNSQASGGNYSCIISNSNPNWAWCPHYTILVPGVVAAHRFNLGDTNFFELTNAGSLARQDGSSVSWNPPSDARMKQNVQPAQVDALALINAVEMVAFDWTDAALAAMAGADIDHKPVPKPRHVELGAIAQQVATLKQSLTAQQFRSEPREGVPDDPLSVDWGACMPYALRAIQQITTRLEALEEKAS